jgi:hypothetical protein
VGYFDELKERGARVIEKRSLSDADREEWTAAVLMLRAFWLTPDGKTVARKELRADKPWWASKVRDGIGPVYLAREAFKLGFITQRRLDGYTWDTVLWTRGYDKKTGKPILVKIGNDFGAWKDAVADSLGAYDIEDPRSDNRRRLAAWAVLIAAAAGAIAITVLTAGVAAPAVVTALGGWAGVAGGTLTAGTVGSQILWSSSDQSELTYNASAKDIAGVTVAVEGSAYGQATGAAIGAGVGAALSGGSATDTADAALRAYGDKRDEQTTTTIAPVAEETTGEAIVSWAKTTGGMITIGAAAVLLVVLATRK